MCLLRFQSAHAAELMRYESNMRKMLQGLHLVKRISEVTSVRHGAVVRHEDCFVPRNEGTETVRHFARSRGRVPCQRNRTESHHRFLTEHLVERPPCACEGRCNRRMGMDDRINVRSSRVNREMHPDFTGYLSGAGELPTIQIDCHYVGTLQQIFAAPRGMGNPPFLIQSTRKISRCPGHESEPAQTFADPDKLPPQLVFNLIIPLRHDSLLSALRRFVTLTALHG